MSARARHRLLHSHHGPSGPSLVLEGGPRPGARAGIVLLVPGAFLGAWCWFGVLERLDRVGIAAKAISLPFESFDGDVAVVREEIARLAPQGPVTVVGHSYSGAVVSAAAHEAANLIFVASRLPLSGESQASITSSWREAEFDAAIAADPDGTTRLRGSARPCLFSDSPANLADLAMALAVPMRSEVPDVPLALPAWHVVPSTYIVCRRDRAVRVERQRERAALVGHSVELDCDHSPFFSAPDALARVVAGTVWAPVAH